MLLLAADTSGKHGSIALAQGDDQRFEVLEVVPLVGGTFSAELVPQIAGLLSRHQLTKAQIEGFAVASGPGSFTGLRVGLAAIKGLAEILKKPIADVSLLEAAAVLAERDDKVIAALDAGRGEAYAGEYELVHGHAKRLSEQLLDREEFIGLVRPQPTAQVISPDKLILNWCRDAGIAAQEIQRPRSDVVARLGLRKLLSGQSISPEQLEANYIRRADAEVSSC